MSLRERRDGARLARLLGDVTIPTAGARYTDKATVTAVQTALKAHGFGLGSTGPNHDGVDGVMGPATSKAIVAMQMAAAMPPTGVIDEGVIMALGVTPGVLPPGVTASGKAAVEAQAAADAATATEHADTPADVQQAAAQVVAAVPSTQPALQAAAKAAAAAVAAAVTPQQHAAAKQQVQAVAADVKAATALPVPWWQWAIIGVGGAAVVGGLGALIFGRKRR